MGYFPFYIDIKDKKCIVIGGGKTALRKIKNLIPFEPDIEVISPEILPEISETENIKIIRREYRNGDIDDAFMVITATDNKSLNEKIFRLCTDKKILVNTVDDIEKCGFIFPSLVHRDDISIGISTSGKSPVFSKFMRIIIDDMLNDDYIEIFQILSRFRPYVKNMFDTEKQRREALESILDFCLVFDENIPSDDEIKDMLERIEKGYENQNSNP